MAQAITTSVSIVNMWHHSHQSFLKITFSYPTIEVTDTLTWLKGWSIHTITSDTHLHIPNIQSLGTKRHAHVDIQIMRVTFFCR